MELVTMTRDNEGEPTLLGEIESSPRLFPTKQNYRALTERGSSPLAHTFCPDLRVLGSVSIKKYITRKLHPARQVLCKRQSLFSPLLQPITD
jgi:hypothetical protein